MLALHEKGGAAQAVLEERLLYFQQVQLWVDGWRWWVISWYIFVCW